MKLWTTIFNDKDSYTIHVATYSYNELGELILKNLGYVNPTTWLQKVNMRYSIRGQLLYINNSVSKLLLFHKYLIIRTRF